MIFVMMLFGPVLRMSNHPYDLRDDSLRPRVGVLMIIKILLDDFNPWRYRPLMIIKILTDDFGSLWSPAPAPAPPLLLPESRVPQAY